MQPSLFSLPENVTSNCHVSQPNTLMIGKSILSALKWHSGSDWQDQKFVTFESCEYRDPSPTPTQIPVNGGGGQYPMTSLHACWQICDQTSIIIADVLSALHPLPQQTNKKREGVWAPKFQRGQILSYLPKCIQYQAFPFFGFRSPVNSLEDFLFYGRRTFYFYIKLDVIILV